MHVKSDYDQHGGDGGIPPALTDRWLRARDTGVALDFPLPAGTPLPPLLVPDVPKFLGCFDAPGSESRLSSVLICLFDLFLDELPDDSPNAAACVGSRSWASGESTSVDRLRSLAEDDATELLDVALFCPDARLLVDCELFFLSE